MKRLIVLMSCAVLSAFATGQTSPKAVPAGQGPSATSVGGATVIQVPAGTNVTVVTPATAQPASQPAYVMHNPASVTVQGERPAAERLPFRAGVSTVTVEKMAQAQGCVGGQGAGLTTPQGPVEVYRMVCESGQVFMARCELRQCRTVSATPYGGYGAMTAAAVTEIRQALRRAEVPALVLDWRCGACVRNDAFAAGLRRSYAAEARKGGMVVSDSATAIVTIHQFNKNIFPLRNSLGMRAVFGQVALDVQESTTAFTGMDLLAENSGRKLYHEMGVRAR